MANMSYCRYENTSNDLSDCVDDLQDWLDDPDRSDKRQSETEVESASRMVWLCKRYLDLYEALEEARAESR
jgi:hypothetical protein